MELRIREADQSDVENGLLETFIEGYRYHQKGRPDIFADVTEEDLKKDLLSNFERLKTIVLTEDGSIAGYLSYMFKEHQTRKMEVDQLVVREGCRGKGYGKMLMEEAEKIARESGCNRVELNCWLFNENALAMYEHIGFKRQRIIYESKV